MQSEQNMVLVHSIRDSSNFYEMTKHFVYSEWFYCGLYIQLHHFDSLSTGKITPERQSSSEQGSLKILAIVKHQQALVAQSVERQAVNL